METIMIITIIVLIVVSIGAAFISLRKTKKKDSYGTAGSKVNPTSNSQE